MDKKLSIIFIPSYQPENTLVVLAKALNERGYKVLIVDDGSGEKFLPIFDEAAKYAEVLHYMPNHGKGYALKYGYDYIYKNYREYECVITADGDGQHHILDINRVSEACLTEKRIIVGDRTFDVKVPLRSKVGNDMSKFTQSLATYRFLHDNQCGLRAFPMGTLPQMCKIGGNRYEYEMNVMNYILNKELPFRMLKVQTIYEEGNKSSHFRPIRDTILIQSVLLKNLIVSLVCFAIQVLGSYLFLRFLFNEATGTAGVIFDYELSVACAIASGLILNIVLSLIVFRPKRPGRTLFRVLLYQLILSIGYFVGVLFFSRVLGLPIALSFFISGVLSIFPLYFLIKGVGLVYDYQNY